MSPKVEGSDGKVDRSPLRPRLVDVHGAALYLGEISPWTVREMHWRGDLPAVRLGRRLLFDVRDLDTLIERNKVREMV